MHLRSVVEGQWFVGRPADSIRGIEILGSEVVGGVRDLLARRAHVLLHCLDTGQQLIEMRSEVPGEGHAEIVIAPATVRIVRAMPQPGVDTTDLGAQFGQLGAVLPQHLGIQPNLIAHTDSSNAQQTSPADERDKLLPPYVERPTTPAPTAEEIRRQIAISHRTTRTNVIVGLERKPSDIQQLPIDPSRSTHTPSVRMNCNKHARIGSDKPSGAYTPNCVNSLGLVDAFAPATRACFEVVAAVGWPATTGFGVIG
ncbi:hypothetical protein ACQPZ2_24595 [Nocardia pseudovaccinii]|uniref:hypothetical protein n=1 Tax=Nocardia pseudovaccinii TaxID=189540 RepID=UPI003D90DDF8